LTCDVRDFSGYKIIEHIELKHDDLTARNNISSENVAPGSIPFNEINDGSLTVNLKPASWNVIRLAQ